MQSLSSNQLSLPGLRLCHQFAVGNFLPSVIMLQYCNFVAYHKVNRGLSCVTHYKHQHYDHVVFDLSPDKIKYIWKSHNNCVCTVKDSEFTMLNYWYIETWNGGKQNRAYWMGNYLAKWKKGHFYWMNNSIWIFCCI